MEYYMVHYTWPKLILVAKRGNFKNTDEWARLGQHRWENCVHIDNVT